MLRSPRSRACFDPGAASRSSGTPGTTATRGWRSSARSSATRRSRSRTSFPSCRRAGCSVRWRPRASRSCRCGTARACSTSSSRAATARSSPLRARAGARCGRSPVRRHVGWRRRAARLRHRVLQDPSHRLSASHRRPLGQVRPGAQDGVYRALSAASESGVFGRPYQAFPSVPQAAAVATGDVTGDGRADVVVTNGYTGNAAVDFRLWVLAQTSSGALAAPARTPPQARTRTASSRWPSATSRATGARTSSSASARSVCRCSPRPPRAPSVRPSRTRRRTGGRYVSDGSTATGRWTSPRSAGGRARSRCS